MKASAIPTAKLVMFDEKTQKTVVITTAYAMIGVYVMQFARDIITKAGKQPTTLICSKQEAGNELGELWICTTGKFTVKVRCLWGS